MTGALYKQVNLIGIKVSGMRRIIGLVRLGFVFKVFGKWIGKWLVCGNWGKGRYWVRGEIRAEID
jgi:hypothetical protein